MSSGVLLVTADAALISAVPRLCALAGVACEVERDSAAARTAWRDARAVLVGFDVAPALSAAALPRREGVVVITMDSSDVGCWQAALALGAGAVLRLPDDEAALVEEIRGGSGSAGVGARVIAVMGGCGGAGASTLAAALAITASGPGKALLLDGDPLGGGLDVLLGAESVPGVRWNELATTRGGLDADAFAAAICDVAGVGLLSWGRPSSTCTMEPSAVDAVLSAATRAFSTVVIDLPRAAIAPTQRLLEASDASVLVVPADVRSVAATAALAALHGRRLGVPHLVVRDPGGGRLAAKDVAASLGMPLTATLRSDSAVQVAAQRGEPPVRRGRCALTQACEDILASVEAGGSSW